MPFCYGFKIIDVVNLKSGKGANAKYLISSSLRRSHAQCLDSDPSTLKVTTHGKMTSATNFENYNKKIKMIFKYLNIK